MNRDEYQRLKSRGHLPVVQVSPSETDNDNEWLCTIAGPHDVVDLMVEDMQSTGGSTWEMGSDDFADCLTDGAGGGFQAITDEIDEDGFRWEEGA